MERKNKKEKKCPSYNPIWSLFSLSTVFSLYLSNKAGASASVGVCWCIGVCACMCVYVKVYHIVPPDETVCECLLTKKNDHILTIKIFKMDVSQLLLIYNILWSIAIARSSLQRNLSKISARFKVESKVSCNERRLKTITLQTFFYSSGR